jgi:hypothetical protein
MLPKILSKALVAILLVAGLSFGSIHAAPPAPASTKPGPTASDTIVLKWKDGKKAVFMLEFDDSTHTHLKTVIPELTKRNMVGTFYIVPGGGLFQSKKAEWTQAAANPNVVLANHTFTHKGVKDAAQLEEEISKAAEVIKSLYPDRKTPRLISFGQPGGVPWKVTKEEFTATLARHHLINRPHFNGPPFHQKSIPEIIAIVDAALAKGEMGHLDFHGVGGDWHVAPTEWFIALLDKLESHREQLWITDPVSWHQYQTQRKTAEVKVVKSTPLEIRLQLSSKTDPALYDLPLSLSTRVPANWKDCSVTQGATKSNATVVDGVATYDAIPGATEIILSPGLPL